MNDCSMCAEEGVDESMCYALYLLHNPYCARSEGAGIMMVSQWRGNVEIYDLFWLSLEQDR